MNLSNIVASSQGLDFTQIGYHATRGNMAEALFAELANGPLQVSFAQLHALRVYLKKTEGLGSKELKSRNPDKATKTVAVWRVGSPLTRTGQVSE